MNARHYFQVWAKSFAACRRGNVAIVFALSLPLVVGGAALGVETTYWYYKRLAMQEAADSAAYAGALDKRSGGDDTEVAAVAKLTSSQNGFAEPKTTIQVVSAAANGGGAVEVVLTDKAERFFTGMFLAKDPTLLTRATATYRDASDACILALSPTASKAVNFSGSSSTTLTGCSVMSNSNASDAMNIQGAALMSTTCVIAVGGAHVTSGLTLTKCSAPLTGQASVADPYASLPTVTAPSGCYGKNPGGGTIDAVKSYCNGLTLKDTTTLSAGTYYVDGDFTVSSNSIISGVGVTIYVKGKVSIPSNSTVNLQAPTSGIYKGVLIFADRNNTQTLKFNGTANSQMTGAIYAAKGDVEYAGNFSGQNGCTQVVGFTVTWTGAATVGINCEAYGMSNIKITNQVRLSA